MESVPTITLPASTEHPEHWSVVQTLLRAGEDIGRVIRLYGAGDVLAERDAGGTPRETALFLTVADRPRTALLLPKGAVSCRDGWGAPPRA